MTARPYHCAAESSVGHGRSLCLHAARTAPMSNVALWADKGERPNRFDHSRPVFTESGCVSNRFGGNAVHVGVEGRELLDGHGRSAQPTVGVREDPVAHDGNANSAYAAAIMVGGSQRRTRQRTNRGRSSGYHGQWSGTFSCRLDEKGTCRALGFERSPGVGEGPGCHGKGLEPAYLPLADRWGRPPVAM